MTKRIYRVSDNDDVRLIEATNPAQALRFCAAQRYRVAPARAQHVAYLMGKGVKVESAAAESEPTTNVIPLEAA